VIYPIWFARLNKLLFDLGMAGEGNEAFAHVLIDKGLRFSGRGLLKPGEARFELDLHTGGGLGYRHAPRLHRTPACRGARHDVQKG
jgi:hypothetical protein